MKRAIVIFCILCFVGIVDTYAQQWTVFNTVNSSIPSNNVLSIVIDNTNNKIIGTPSGIGIYNDVTWTVFNTYSYPFFNNGIAVDANNNKWLAPNNGLNTLCLLNDSCYSHIYYDLGIPHTYQAYVLAIDTNNNIWLSGSNTGSGDIVKFDGNTWTEYYSTGAPCTANSIEIDSSQNMWIGGYNYLFKFDGINWSEYNISAPSGNNVNSIAIDINNNKWLGTQNGLTKFDGIFTNYNTSNSNLPSNLVRSVAIDSIGIIWAGTDYGLAKYDGVNWTIFTKFNSGLPSNNIISLAIDKNNIIWIGTSDEGLVAFNEQGSGFNDTHKANTSVNVFPNPFSTEATIQVNNKNNDYDNFEFKLYDISGRLVKKIYFNDSEFKISKDKLECGLYTFQLLKNNTVLLTQKITIVD